MKMSLLGWTFTAMTHAKWLWNDTYLQFKFNNNNDTSSSWVGSVDIVAFLKELYLNVFL